MFYRIAFFAALALFLTSCSHTRSGPTVPSLMQTLGQPADGMARVIVFREKGFSGAFDFSWPVDLDGTALGELKTGTFAYRDCPAGKHSITDAKWDMPGVSRLDFEASSGRTYIVAIRVSPAGTAYTTGIAVAATFGLAAASLAAGSSPDVRKTGGFVFIPVDEAKAGPLLADIHLLD